MKTLSLLMVSLFVVAAASPASRPARGQSLPQVDASNALMREDFGADIDRAVERALLQGKLPGCVVVVGRQGMMVHRKAYGLRRIVPSTEGMTLDTVFDLASLTKPIVTSTSILQLVERGDVRLRDKVSDYFPEFAANGKDEITIEQLLVHSSGLIPDNPVEDFENGWPEAMKRICDLRPQSTPGEKFKYSDVGFLVLGRIVEKVTGMPLDEYAAQHIFEPLGMSESTFSPDEALRRRAAPTEKADGEWLRGVVHDPRARLLGGVAGHAGLFSTADDLARYANALLEGGLPIVTDRTLELWTTPIEIDGNLRGLGWDMQSVYSRNRGEAMSPRAFGHGGFTGTAIWIDSEVDLFVIFLSNRVHPSGNGEVNDLAGRIGTIASAACLKHSAVQEVREPVAQPTVLGIDVLVDRDFEPLKGKRVGLIANHTSRNAEGRSTVEILAAAEGVELVALFSPEHGFSGVADREGIEDGVDPDSKLPIYSLYGATRKPLPEQLREVDTLVFDIQDIGCRFYTYLSTMGLSMEAAGEQGKSFVVLDRPNPIGGSMVEGPVLDTGKESFVGFHSISVRHGMTVGELARMIEQERALKLDLQVVKMENWGRSDYLYDTGLTWIDTSPNMRSLTAAVLYPGIGLFEMTNVSVGRGTDTPFEVFGAPWIDGRELASRVSQAGLQGVRVVPITFTPTASRFEGQQCGGIAFVVTDWNEFEALPLAWVLAHELAKLYPNSWDMANFDRLLSSNVVMRRLREGADPIEIERSYQSQLVDFKRRRHSFLLY